MPRKIAINSRKLFLLLVILIWTQSILLPYVEAVIMRFPFIGGFHKYIVIAAFVIAIIFSFPYYTVTSRDLVFLFSTVILFLIEWGVYQEAEAYIRRYMVDFIILILPLYVIGVSFARYEDKNKVIKLMYYLSITTIAIDIIYRFTMTGGMSQVMSMYQGDMDKAYKILPHCCLVLYFAIKERKAISIIFAVIGGLYLLMLGTRGAALLFLIMFAVLLIMGNTSKWRTIRIIAVFGLAGVFLLSSWYESVLLFLQRQAQSLGLSVRIFNKLISGEAMRSNDRGLIWSAMFNAIKEKPFIGNGLCADRVINGYYAHNIAIELWVDFGVIFGSIILAFVITIIISGYSKTDSEYEKGFIMSLFFSSFCMMFVSGSFLEEPLPMLLLGFCVGIARSSKRNNSLNKLFV